MKKLPSFAQIRVWQNNGILIRCDLLPWKANTVFLPAASQRLPITTLSVHKHISRPIPLQHSECVTKDVSEPILNLLRCEMRRLYSFAGILLLAIKRLMGLFY